MSGYRSRSSRFPNVFGRDRAPRWRLLTGAAIAGLLAASAVALAQPWGAGWGGGMMGGMGGMMGIGVGLMWQGLYGTPRRDWISSLSPDPFVHPIPMAITAAAGLVLLTALICFVVVTVGTLASRPVVASEVTEIPFGNAPVAEDSRWVRLMDRLGLWTLVAFLLILAVYGPLFAVLLSHQVSIPPNTAY
ncbi:hypothetical protein [Acidiphilium cryptum]|uniref:Uncharacterized protein n=1 Tax=Acidiphilium cryptum (strain JF-5) TaxID=349163 RepID=A5FTY6_ACICJ|nr:hypothetical protein [Acidiphilium cryptum]ABQ29068.1 hypothetical protein Acry_3465 [Acidiphilium cryptum JF-5]